MPTFSPSFSLPEELELDAEALHVIGYQPHPESHLLPRHDVTTCVWKGEDGTRRYVCLITEPVEHGAVLVAYGQGRGVSGDLSARFDATKRYYAVRCRRPSEPVAA